MRRASAKSEAAGKRRGRGIVYYVDNTGIFNDRMEMRFDPSGIVTILAGTLSHGQGHETAYAQMVVGLAQRAVRQDPASPRPTPTRSRSAAAPTPRAA